MRALLDTHTFLWFVTGDRALSPAAESVVRPGAHELLLSIASVWEISIKAGLGRLDFALPVEEFVPEQLQLNRVSLLPVALEHATQVAALPQHHRDPFDRMLVVQARMEAVPIISADPVLDRYGIHRLW